MYYYIYDSFLENPKYRKILDRVEIRLADLSISGEASHVRPLRNLEEIVLEGLNQGKRTIIAVGNDQTLKQVARAVLRQKNVPLSDLTIGIIPVGKPNFISQGLGVPGFDAACEIISGRIIRTIDLGQVNHESFLTCASLGFGSRKRDRNRRGHLSRYRSLRYRPQEIIFKIDDQFQIRLDLFQANFINLSLTKAALPLANPCDGILNVLITAKLSRFSLWKSKKLIEAGKYALLPKTSIFQAKKIEIIPPRRKKVNIFGDFKKISRAPAIISISPQKLRMIVGKERTFE